MKVAACLEPDLYVYLTPRVSQDLLTNKKAGLKDLQSLINDETLYLQLQKGPYHPIKWIVQDKDESETDSEEEQNEEEKMSHDEEEEKEEEKNKSPMKNQKGKRVYNISDDDDADIKASSNSKTGKQGGNRAP